MSYRVTRHDPKTHNTHIEAKCMVCSVVTQLIVPTLHFDKWVGGELIQNALPQLSPATRELLISGVCGTCFDAIVEEHEDED